MSSAGQVALRAYIYQSIVALIKCLERDDWDEIIIEPDMQYNKLDIVLYSNEEITTAIQVKASVNTFNRAQIKDWLDGIKDVTEAREICLYLVGDSFTPGSLEYINEHNNLIEVISFNDLYSICVGTLVQYLKDKKYLHDITIEEIDMVGANFIPQLLISNRFSESPISRTTFEEALEKTLLLGKNNKYVSSNLECIKNPKVFISYSWTNYEYVMKVRKLAKRLRSDGVDAILDEWSMHAGQDMDVFMEHSIRDADKVLILCDKGYTLKANERVGGVGKETSIISPEVYGKFDQRKFIPVCMESIQDVPTYLKTKWAVKMNDDNPDSYTDLIGEIFEVDKKPLLGPINYELIRKASK